MNMPVKRIPQWILLALPMSMPGWTFSSILEHVLPVLTLITFVLLFFVLPVALSSIFSVLKYCCGGIMRDR